VNIYIGCDNLIKYTGAKDSDSGTYLNTGTCSYTLTDSAGATIGSGTLSYVAASNGNYEAIVDAVVAALLEDGAIYTLTVTFVQGNYDDKRQLAVSAAYRRST